MSLTNILPDAIEALAVLACVRTNALIMAITGFLCVMGTGKFPHIMRIWMEQPGREELWEIYRQDGKFKRNFIQLVY
jgi:hypothetical protein